MRGCTSWSQGAGWHFQAPRAAPDAAGVTRTRPARLDPGGGPPYGKLSLVVRFAVTVALCGDEKLTPGSAWSGLSWAASQVNATV